MARKLATRSITIFLLFITAALTQAGTNAIRTRTVVISHVNVVPMDSERVLPDRTVLIEGGKIRRIEAGTIAAPKDAIQVDGHGKYLMPGLADLHVHLFSPDDLDAYTLYGV